MLVGIVTTFIQGDSVAVELSVLPHIPTLVRFQSILIDTHGQGCDHPPGSFGRMPTVLDIISP